MLELPRLACDWLTVALSCRVRALGCRLDSGDLSYLSQEVRKMTTEASKTFNRPFLATTNIVASNDINEESLHSLGDQVRVNLVMSFSLCGGSRLLAKVLPVPLLGSDRLWTSGALFFLATSDHVLIRAVYTCNGCTRTRKQAVNYEVFFRRKTWCTMVTSHR